MNLPAIAFLFSFLVGTGAVASASGDERDRVVLKTGKEIRCRVVLELDQRIAVVVGTRERWIDRDEIASISSVRRSLGKILSEFDTTEDTPDALLALAKKSEKASLPHEARIFYWRVVRLQPDHAVAHTALGHKQAGAEWRIPVARTWRDLESAEKIRSEWGKAWRMRSEHFEIRTDGGVDLALRTLLELESFYRHLFDLFQVSLELREVLIPIRVELYRDGKDFPRQSNNVDAYFSRDDNILFTFLDDAKRPLTLFHQATHATIHNLGGSSRGRRTELPGWLNEGWADYLEGILEPGKGGRVRVDLTRRLSQRIGNLAAEKKPYSLRRVLNFRESDFAASSKQKLKYAQSYALVLLLMEGNEGKYASRFLDYMKQALDGKASSSQFRGVFKKDLKAIEAGHVKMK